MKKDVALSAVRKVERLREIGSSIDEKLKPLLNPEQQEKFQALREQLRRRLLGKMASEAAENVEADIKAWFTGKSVK